jgi:hypothetical protein
MLVDRPAAPEPDPAERPTAAAYLKIKMEPVPPRPGLDGSAASKVERYLADLGIAAIAATLIVLAARVRRGTAAGDRS